MRTTITIGEMSLECDWFGPRPSEAPTIVMMHEGLGALSTWRNFPERVAQATRAGVFAFSRAGYGRSSPAPLPRPVDYLHREAVDVLPRVLDAIGFTRGILLGHSDGGSIAAIYAGSHQDHRVRGLVLIEPHFFVEDMNIAAIRRTAEDYKTTDLRTRLQRHHANADDTVQGWLDFWLHPQFKSFDIREELRHIRVPILIVKGENDPYGTIEQIRAAENECYCPVESVVVPNARHAPHHDQPELTLEAIASFINHILWFHQEARPQALSPNERNAKH
jgi:pimeloyl-ACP methyl ester carboxylesterase